MKKIYNKIHGLLEKLENILLKAKAKVDAIKAKIQKIIDQVLPKIGIIAAILSAIILVVKILCILGTMLMSLCPPIGGGACVGTIAKIVIKAASIAGAFGGAVKAVSKAVKKYMKIALTILGVILGVVAIILTVLGFVQRIKAFIEFLYLMYIQMCNTNDESVMDADGNINEALLEKEILRRDPTGMAASDIDLATQGLGGVEALQASGLYNTGEIDDGEGILTSAGNTNYGLGGDDGLGGWGGTGIMATTSGTGHTGLGNDTRPNDELYSISDKLTSMYEDLVIELKGRGKMEIVEHLNALDFGFQTRYERKIIPIP